MSLCWAARGGEALELSNPLSGELGITSAATCLPTSACQEPKSQTHAFIHTKNTLIDIHSQTNICTEKKTVGTLGISSGATWLTCIQKTTIPNLSQDRIGPSLLATCLLRSKNNESATEFYGIFANKREKRSKYTETAT